VWPQFDVERTSVRVVLLDRGGRVLLFATIDPTMPQTGTWWELPGGGMEPGEGVADTAVRELAEETGLHVGTEQVEPTRWRRSTTYLRRHVRTLQHEHVVVVRLDRDVPDLDPAGRTAEELQDYVGHRWWSSQELADTADRFFPGRLPELLAPALAGEVLDEPFEQWN
jgi:8-oxo-dGTP pyrophosphatase MutT (NUDIX family)